MLSVGKPTKFLVTFDADGQHDVADIPRVLVPLQQGAYDVVLGSRFLREGGQRHPTAGKRLVLRCAVMFTKLTTGQARLPTRIMGCVRLLLTRRHGSTSRTIVWPMRPKSSHKSPP